MKINCNNKVLLSNLISDKSYNCNHHKNVMTLRLDAVIFTLSDDTIFVAERVPPSLESGIKFVPLEHILDPTRNISVNRDLIKSYQKTSIFYIENVSSYFNSRESKEYSMNEKLIVKLIGHNSIEYLPKARENRVQEMDCIVLLENLYYGEY